MSDTALKYIARYNFRAMSGSKGLDFVGVKLRLWGDALNQNTPKTLNP